jgi:NAD(P)-dependent dehydrogenase (short-subunit alcohol dehydrogenase family)
MLAARGARVSLIARSGRKLAEAPRPSAPARPPACAVADVADRGALLAAMEQAERAFGPVAGCSPTPAPAGASRPCANMTMRSSRPCCAPTSPASTGRSKRVLPAMRERGRQHRGDGSLASERGMPHNVAYVASKHAVLGLARAAAAEAAPHNVRVNCVVPGFIETPMLMQLDASVAPQVIRERLGAGVPLGRIGTADELAELVCFLLSDRAAHITGQSLAVDGGILGTLIPR